MRKHRLPTGEKKASLTIHGTTQKHQIGTFVRIASVLMKSVLRETVSSNGQKDPMPQWEIKPCSLIIRASIILLDHEGKKLSALTLANPL